MGHAANGTNKILSREFRGFCRKWSFCFWVSPWKFVSNLRCGRTKFVQFLLKTGLFSLGEIVRSLCLKI